MMRKGTEAKRIGQGSLKLRLELVPETLWGISACNVLGGRAAWQRIRIAELNRAGHRCDTCGGTSKPLYCREQWRYDDENAVATLSGFQIACIECNHVHHIGQTNMRVRFRNALTHFCRVSRITDEYAKHIFGKARAVWGERSRKDWRIAVTPSLLKLYPQLDVLVGIDTRDVGRLLC